MIHRFSFWLLCLLHILIVVLCCKGALSQTVVDSPKGSPVADIGALEEAGVKAAVQQVTTSVVQIETIGGNADDGGVSTGTVVSADGLVLTAAYNLRHEPTSIFVNAFAVDAKQPERFIAKLLATDNSRNLCLLKTELPEGVELAPAVAAEEGSLRVGTTTIAVGKVHDATSATISVGILSATDRIWGRAVQTDAKISRTNYGGPLINLAGDTIGVLVPLSPNDGDVEAGAEWYDSGIGFAVPLENYYASINRMAQEEDLHQGLVGVTLTGKDLYADAPVIEFCSPRSPASESGLMEGDTITAVDGVPVISQSQMKHVTGPKYAGDKISLTVMRGEQEKTFTATLTDRIDPFVELVIGVIPDRSSKSATIAKILPDTPAAATPLIQGDIISAVNTEEVKTWEDFQSELNKLEPDAKIEIVVRNESEANRSAATTKTIEVAPLSAIIPPEDLKDVPADDAEKQTWKSDEFLIQVAGSANLCTAFVPGGGKEDAKNHFPLLVWVAQPGTKDLEKIRESVEPLVTQHGVVVLVPESLNPRGWSPEESEFITKAIGRLKKRIDIDDNRIAIGGETTAARMSCLTAFLNRETFRGLIMFDSLFPRRIPQIKTRPDQRLMILLATSAEFTGIDKLEKMKKVIEKRKFPIAHVQSQKESLSDMLPQVARWIDGLDRH